MKPKNLERFYTNLENDPDYVFTYNGAKYMFTMWPNSDLTHNVSIFPTEGENMKDILHIEYNTIENIIKSLQSTPIFEGKSFTEVYDDLKFQ